ncbi:MAG: hypothetical protein IT370_11400 [Deltaproteobacteria bacterium]|nr:hypothetical protein [Deltaproteobacteria bacterium]
MRALFLIAMGCVVGCGGGDGTMGGDGGMVTVDSMVNTGTVTEAEGATRSNDSTSAAESIKLGDTVNGTIGAMVAGMGTDQDYYKFSITAPTLVRITLQTRASGDYQALGVLVHSTGQTIENIVRPGSDTSMASREAFLSRTGNYHVRVVDLRNEGATPANVGGPTSTYMFKVEAVTPTPTAVTLPLPAGSQMVTVPADGKVTIFEFTTPAANHTIKAETRASRLSPASNVDTLIYLMDQTQTTASQVDYSDDISTGAMNYDSLISIKAPRAGKHWVVADFTDITGAARNLTITIEDLGP